MHIIVCLDQKNGMMFCGKRQSKDRLLRAHMLHAVGTHTLWMNDYSAGQFEETADCIRISEQFLTMAQNSEFCFVENQDILLWENAIENIVVYRWDRVYPASIYFPEKLLSARKLVHTESFAGHSHDEIIQEVYSL